MKLAITVNKICQKSQWINWRVYSKTGEYVRTKLSLKIALREKSNKVFYLIIVIFKMFK